MRHAAPAPQHGFTLLELIVALAISSLVALMGASALSGMLDFQHRSAQRGAAREDVRATERIVRHEWAGRGNRIRSDGQSLEFDTLYPVGGAPDAASLARVRLACETTPDGALELLHYVSAVAATGQAPTQQSTRWQKAQVLVTHLQTCAFAFLVQIREADGQVQPQWLSKWDEKNPAPQLMRLSLSGLGQDMPPVVYAARIGSP